MMFAGFFCLLLLTGASTYESSDYPYYGERYNQHYTQDLLSSECSYIKILNYLNLTDKVKFSMTRPTSYHTWPTDVHLDVLVYAILDVREKEQKFVTYIWINMWWVNDFISWDTRHFCGIRYVSVPSELLWKPDITIEEMTERDRAYQSPYLNIAHDGTIVHRNSMVLVSTCRMQFYRFPLDTQVCRLTFKSITHFAKDLKIFHTDRGNDTMMLHDGTHTETEWRLMNITFENKTDRNFHFDSSVLICTITMRRRSVLYVVNFILPVFFFLGLDLASFLISESRGEKLGFKVTVLLAITVMQLILNDILPSSSDSIPLIAVYCVGVIGMMMLSLLETILMMYLMEKDNVSPDKDQNQSDDSKDNRGEILNCFQDVNKSISCVRIYDVSPGEMPPELLPLGKEGSRSQLTEESHDPEKLYSELSEVLQALTQVLSSRKEEGEPGYWTRMTKRIDRVYLIIYIITASLFLGFLFSRWIAEEN